MIISYKTPLLLSLFLVLSCANQTIAQTDSTFAKEEAELNIFPNPNRGTFYITVVNDEFYQSKLYAMDGRIVKTIYLKSGLNYVSVNVPAGLYLLEVGEGDMKQQFKISIK
jgi:hypothetical protein